MVKAIFFDIDGTLLSRDGTLSDKTIYSLEKLKEKGIKCIVASGRHMEEIKTLPICDYHFDGYILLNGQLILDENKIIIEAHPLDKEDMVVLEEAFLRDDLPIVFVEKDRLYLNYESDQVIEAQQSIASITPEFGEYQGDVVYQASIFADKDQIEILTRKLKKSKITKWHNFGYDLINISGGKHNGILKMLEYYHIDREDTMAFGDGENDISMFEVVGLSIAMGDADDYVKKYAKEVTDSAKDDGIYNALRRHNII